MRLTSGRPWRRRRPQWRPTERGWYPCRRLGSPGGEVPHSVEGGYRRQRSRNWSETLRAEVAELADALDSGSSARKGVGVRVPASAPTRSGTYNVRDNKPSDASAPFAVSLLSGVGFSVFSIALRRCVGDRWP